MVQWKLRYVNLNLCYQNFFLKLEHLFRLKLFLINHFHFDIIDVRRHSRMITLWFFAYSSVLLQHLSQTNVCERIQNFFRGFWDITCDYKMSHEIQELIKENLEFYRRVKSEKSGLFQSFHVLLTSVDRIIETSEAVNGFASEYDLDKNTKGNGHHSFVYVCDKALKRTAKTCREVKEKRRNFFFKKDFYQK